MKGAIEAVDTDPRQALRALLAQADALETIAAEMRDWTAASAAKDFKDYLGTAMAKGRFSTAHVMRRARTLQGPAAASAGAQRSR